MKVTKIGDRYQVRVEELLPCPRFSCTHEMMSCATTTWCPDGCHDSNHYNQACIPLCADCIYYPNRCEDWKNFPEKWNHEAVIV